MQYKEYHGRFAPSPTGPLHVGNARTALVAWCAARHHGGSFTIRIEDLDQPRVISDVKDAHLEDLRWLGIDWDHGPDVGGPHAPYLQSQRLDYYQTALDKLHALNMLFPCGLSRKNIREQISASTESSCAYPAYLRPSNLSTNWYEEANSDMTIRCKAPQLRINFIDAVCGPQSENVGATVGDFPLRRRDGVFSYQLAVSVDDLDMGITEIVRGRDLIGSTARQLWLIDLLGGTPPCYAHVPLMVNPHGEKLSKRDSSMSLCSIRDSGVTSEAFVGYLAWTLGWIPKPCSIPAKNLVQFFDWHSMSQQSDCILPENFGSPCRSDVTLQH